MYLRCLKKAKNRRKQNFEDEANNMHLDKECTQRSNLNGKYLSANLVLKFPDFLFYFHILLLSSIGLLVMYDLILRYEARVNALDRLVLILFVISFLILYHLSYI